MTDDRLSHDSFGTAMHAVCLEEAIGIVFDRALRLRRCQCCGADVKFPCVVLHEEPTSTGWLAKIAFNRTCFLKLAGPALYLEFLGDPPDEINLDIHVKEEAK